MSTDKTERLEQEQREAAHTRLQVDRMLTDPDIEKLQHYLETHRWVTRLEKVSETETESRYYVFTFLTDSQPDPFIHDAITVEEIRMEWQDPVEHQPGVEGRGLLGRLLFGSIPEREYLCFLIRVDKEACRHA